MKKLFRLTALLTALAIAAGCSACSKKGGGAEKSDDSRRVEDSFSRASDSFSYSAAEPSAPDKKPPAADRAEAFPEVAEIYSLAELDGSYNGTDRTRGFGKAMSRDGGAFTTYPLGFGEGTTGGRGAAAEDVYTVSTGDEFLAALKKIKERAANGQTPKSIIAVDGTITEENTLTGDVNYQIVVDSVSNILIVGVENRGVFDGVGLNFKSSNNVIVQNLTITHPSKTLRNEKDCLEFNTCRNVWVDHCELYNDYPANSSEKDYYDGLCDVKNDSANVTISYTKFHDAWKTSLVGSGPDDVVETRTLTYHHNIFENCNSRVPLIRGGRAHVYNNYYHNIGTGINCRFDAEVYVENNIFDNVKNPICSIEETKGKWNAVGNSFVGGTSGSGLNNGGSSTDYTPSYGYILDPVDGLKEYLDSTVGVGKIDFETATSEPTHYEKYEADINDIISREISELGSIALNNETLQRLVYISEEILFDEGFDAAKVPAMTDFISAIDAYAELYAADLDEKFLAVNPSSDFSVAAYNFYSAKRSYESAPKIIKDKVKQKSLIIDLSADFDENFVDEMNSRITALNGAGSDKIDEIERLLKLYEWADDGFKTKIDVDGLENAYISADNHIKAKHFSALVAALPEPNEVDYLHEAKIREAEKEYRALTNGQFALVGDDVINKFNGVCEAFDALIKKPRSLDLSAVNVGRTSAETAAGGFRLGVSVDVRACEVAFGGASYNKEVYFSGYGNRGSKCLQFTLYSDSTVTIVAKGESGVTRIKLADDNNVELDGKTVGTEITEISFENLPAGEYRIFTDIPDGTVVTGSRLLVYAAEIKPTV